MELSDLDQEIDEIHRDIEDEFGVTQDEMDEISALIANPIVQEEIARKQKEFATWCHRQPWWSSAVEIITTCASLSITPSINRVVTRQANPAHHTQVGDNGDDSADSHVTIFFHHYQRMIIWTSAIELVADILPTTQLVKKHTYLIGNNHLDLVDYPADFTPDYSFLTLTRAAIEVGYGIDSVDLDSALQSTVGVPNHPLWWLYNRFERHMQDTLPPLPDDLALRMKILDPDGTSYAILAKRVARRMMAGWERDPMYDDMCGHAVNLGYTKALRSFNPQFWAPDSSLEQSFARYLYRCVIGERRDAVKSTHLYASPAAIGERVAKTLLPALRSICMEGCINPVETQQMLDSIANYFTGPRAHAGRVAVAVVRQLVADLRTRVVTGLHGATEDRQRAVADMLENLEGEIDGLAGGCRVVPTWSLDAPMLSDAEGSISVVDTLMGDAGDMVGSLERTAASADVRELFSGPVISDLLEKLTSVTKKTLGCGEHHLEFLADVILYNKEALELVKKTIGSSGLAQLARHI